MGKTNTKGSHRFKLGGIKLSEELAFYSCRYPHNISDTFSRLLDVVAAQQINIHYLCHSADPESVISSLCVAAECHSEVYQLLHGIESDMSQFYANQSTGTLTLFPHRHNLRLLLDVLRLFRHHGLPVHGFCTSISAVTMVMNHLDLDRSVTVLENLVDLPENHAPMRQEFAIRQICI